MKPRAKRSAPASLARSVLKPCALSRLCHLIMSSRRDRERERGEEERKRDGERERGGEEGKQERGTERGRTRAKGLKREEQQEEEREREREKEAFLLERLVMHVLC